MTGLLCASGDMRASNTLLTLPSSSPTPLAQIREEFPDRMMATFSVIPSPKVRSWRLNALEPVGFN